MTPSRGETLYCPNEVKFPLVFSRGQTPEIKQCTPSKNIFSFETARSPYDNKMGNSPFKKFGFDYMTSGQSPCPPDQLRPSGLSPQPSPAFNFTDNSAYRRGIEQNYFFNPMLNPSSIGKSVPKFTFNQTPNRDKP